MQRHDRFHAELAACADDIGVVRKRGRVEMSRLRLDARPLDGESVCCLMHRRELREVRAIAVVVIDRDGRVAAARDCLRMRLGPARPVVDGAALHLVRGGRAPEQEAVRQIGGASTLAAGPEHEPPVALGRLVNDHEHSVLATPCPNRRRVLGDQNRPPPGCSCGRAAALQAWLRQSLRADRGRPARVGLVHRPFGRRLRSRFQVTGRAVVTGPEYVRPGTSGGEACGPRPFREPSRTRP